MPYRIAILWRGDREARRTATSQNNRYHRIFEELAVLDIHAEPAVFDEEFADEVREQLLATDAVLVWVDPISRGKTRTVLDVCSMRYCAMSQRADPHDRQDGRQESPAPNETSRLGD